MTPRQFQIEFERASYLIDDVKNGILKLNSEDINYYINEAIHVFITKKFKETKSGNGIKRSQKKLDEIKELIVKNSILIKDSGLSTIDYDVYTLPSDYFLLLSDKSLISYCSNEKVFQNRMYSTEEIQEILEDTHYTTKYNSPVSELVDDKLYVYKKTSFSLSQVSIDYIKNWDNVDIINDTNTNLNPSTHKDIVNLAVLIFLESINNSRFNSNIEKNIITKQVSIN